MQRTIKVQIKRNSKRTSLSRELHTHTHTRTTRNTTDATVQDLEWGVFRVCVDDRKTYLQMCPMLYARLRGLFGPCPPPPLLWTPPSTRNIQDLEIVLWMTPPLSIGLNTPKHEANLAITLSCLCLILPYRIQTCRAKLSIT